MTTNSNRLRVDREGFFNSEEHALKFGSLTAELSLLPLLYCVPDFAAGWQVSKGPMNTTREIPLVVPLPLIEKHCFKVKKNWDIKT